MLMLDVAAQASSPSSSSLPFLFFPCASVIPGANAAPTDARAYAIVPSEGGHAIAAFSLYPSLSKVGTASSINGNLSKVLQPEPVAVCDPEPDPVCDAEPVADADPVDDAEALHTLRVVAQQGRG
eukprot:tig00020927_g15933.t1